MWIAGEISTINLIVNQSSTRLMHFLICQDEWHRPDKRRHMPHNPYKYRGQ
jgi:hypothetical protein